MNERLPYEEQLGQQWNDLPLPDENMAWADMKRRLDKDNRRIIPFWWSGCAGWGLLGILLLGIIWWIIRPEKWFDKKSKTKKINTIVDKKNPAGIDTSFKRTDTGTTQARTTGDSILNSKTADNTKTKRTAEWPNEKEKIATTDDAKMIIKPGLGVVSKKKKEPPSQGEVISKKNAQKNNSAVSSDKKGNEKSVADSTALVAVPVKHKPDSANDMVKKIAAVDSVNKATKDSTIKKPEEIIVAGDKKPKKDSVKSNKIIFSAGIGMHQQLPVSGQKLTPYNSAGRKGSIGDYIPSVYVRMEKEKKWFLQSEFRYGAPQYTKEFTYRQVSVPDTGFNPQFSTSTSSTLKKTFYHQLPVTFNYYIMPNWSVGTGFQWNKFKAAVSEETISRRNNITQQDSLAGKLTETVKKDSATEFAKSYFQFVLETQYKWKRFSFGAKYSFGLQPYIKFTLPGQPEKQERNNALQIFIRYELWKQKKN